MTRKVTSLVGLPASSLSGVCGDAIAREGRDGVTLCPRGLALDATMADGLTPCLDLSDESTVGDKGVGVEVHVWVDTKDLKIRRVGKPFQFIGLDVHVEQAIVLAGNE